MLFAGTPKPPYWSVVFTSRLKKTAHGYAETARKMEELARSQPGFLGVESVRDENGEGITVSYWESETAIRNWSRHPEHRAAQAKAGEWYDAYRVRICKVEKDHDPRD